MLFRPLRTWRVFGVRVPFTPGIIPRRRGELAESIGRMVSRQLLTPEVFQARFEQDRFQLAVRRGLSAVLETVGELKIGELESRADWRAGLLGLVQAVAGALGGDQETRVQLADHIAHVAAGYWRRLTPTLAVITAGTRPLREVDYQLVDRLVARGLAVARPALSAWLRSPATRQEMEMRAKRILQTTLDQMNAVGQLFVLASRNDQRLMARVPEIVEKVIVEIERAAEGERVRHALVETLYRWVEQRRYATVTELAAEAGTRWERVVERTLEVVSPTELERRVREALALWLADPTRRGANIETLLQSVARWLERHAERTVAEAIPSIWRRKALITRRLARLVQRGLLHVAGTFVAHLDVHTVVVERINALDVERVEELLLGIIRRHLAWINVFGALLGALIGATQVLGRLLNWF